jgi:hypothetical protein
METHLYFSIPLFSVITEYRDNLTLGTGVAYSDTKAVPQFRPSVAVFPSRRHGFNPRSDHVGFMVDKVALRQVFTDSSVFTANSHSTDCSTFIIIYDPGLVQ